MPRNLRRRVELLTPINDAGCREYLRKVLATYFRDNTNAWRMRTDGGFEKIDTGDRPYRSQERLWRMAKSRADDEPGGRSPIEPVEA